MLFVRNIAQSKLDREIEIKLTHYRNSLLLATIPRFY